MQCTHETKETPETEETAHEPTAMMATLGLRKTAGLGFFLRPPFFFGVGFRGEASSRGSSWSAGGQKGVGNSPACRLAVF